MSDDINDDEVPFSRKKRSVRDRLGSNVSDSDFYESQQRNKRYLYWFCYFHSLYSFKFLNYIVIYIGFFPHH